MSRRNNMLTRFQARQVENTLIELMPTIERDEWSRGQAAIVLQERLGFPVTDNNVDAAFRIIKPEEPWPTALGRAMRTRLERDRAARESDNGNRTGTLDDYAREQYEKRVTHALTIGLNERKTLAGALLAIHAELRELDAGLLPDMVVRLKAIRHGDNR